MLEHSRKLVSQLWNKRVAVLISGGVDSCVAASLLKPSVQKGNLVGVFMKNWEDDEDDERCQSQYETDRYDAKHVCDKLDIEFKEVNFVKEYWNHVFSHFMQDFENGLTPNPDILCNQRVKFGACLDYAVKQLNSDLIATGHYAGNSHGPLYETPCGNEHRMQLLRSRDTVKDQTFFLSRINQDSLSKVLFPLHNYLKPEVKLIAEQMGFDRFQKKKSSKGICFIGKRNYQDFITKYMKPNPGKFVDYDTNEVVGEHKGFHYWTVGQHARIHSNVFKRKYYILKKSSLDDNIIYVVSETNHPKLFNDIFEIGQPHWIGQEPSELSRGQELRCMYKWQQKDDLKSCSLSKISSNSLKVKLYDKQRALTPGQYSAFYLDGICLGSARITNVEFEE